MVSFASLRAFNQIDIYQSASAISPEYLEIRFVRRLGEELAHIVTGHPKQADVAVAFVRQDGLDILESLGMSVHRGIVGAFGITEPSAIQRLVDSGSEVHVAEVEQGEFHPKVYLIPHDDSLAALVGSSNLTRGGLESNEEANLLLSGMKTEPPIPLLLSYFSELWNFRSIEVSKEWLDEYRARYEMLSERRATVEAMEHTSANDISLTVAQRLSERASGHWIVIASQENFRKCLEFGLWGVERQVNTIKEVKPGDVITFYVKGSMRFSGVYRVESFPFYDITKVWDDGIYPWRVKIKPANISASVDARTAKDELNFVKDKSIWGTYFQMEMREVSDDDFLTIISRMKKLAQTAGQNEVAISRDLEETD